MEAAGQEQPNPC